MATRFSICDLSDANPGLGHRCSLPFKDFGKRRYFHGPIRTVVTMEDSQLAYHLFQEPGNGGVIVIDGGGSMNTALLGDARAALLKKNGWAGVIVNGAVRDAADLATIDIGIKALGSSFIRSSENGVGAIDVPVAFGHVLFEPGHYVYCDWDGVLVSPRELTAA
ncbi:MAG: ribonuclease E activity regulator RraA [Magnetospiraceae bacterium]